MSTKPRIHSRKAFTYHPAGPEEQILNNRSLIDCPFPYHPHSSRSEVSKESGVEVFPVLVQNTL